MNLKRAIASRMNTRVVRALSLAILMSLFWYIMVAPSLVLAPPLPHPQEYSEEAKQIAKFDLENKVYPEIQDRLTKTNDWLITKVIFAGSLLGAFLIQLWWPLWSKPDLPISRRKGQFDRIFYDLLKSRQMCAVLGIACIVSLFMDLHIRRSLLVVQQLGVWAAKYADRALAGEVSNGIPGWEQFIRMDGGMQRSIIDALQTADLGIMTLVLFAFYHWNFQEACMQKLDELNRLIYYLFIFVLLIFVIGTHFTSNNFRFYNYNWESVWGTVASDPRSYLIAWFMFLMILVLWDVSGARFRANKSQQRL